MNNTPNTQKRIVDYAEGERRKLTQRLNTARTNILIVVALTLINVFILLFDGDSYFVFSASFPYIMVFYAMFLCGKFPIEYYELAEGEEIYPLGNGVFAIMLVIAFVSIALYFLSWIMSKKHGIAWIIFALVMFVIDTLLLVLVLGVEVDNLIDLAFHIWVLVSFVMGIVSYFKLKKLPEPYVVTVEVQTAEEKYGEFH